MNIIKLKGGGGGFMDPTMGGFVVLLNWATFAIFVFHSEYKETGMCFTHTQKNHANLVKEKHLLSTEDVRVACGRKSYTFVSKYSACSLFLW